MCLEMRNLSSYSYCSFFILGLIFSLFHLFDCCVFPEHWNGNWYQSGIRKTISIRGDRFTSKGVCVASEGDKFLIKDNDCYRCIVILEKHYNVLQYKETFCHERETLSRICALITGEALLYSMFRENATAISCPFKPPYTFTYNRGHGECRHPVSTIESCIRDSKIVIQYQACPDVYGSESSLEEILCLAVWKEGSYRYLVGKLSTSKHRSGILANGDDHYRCFVFEKSSSFSSLGSLADFELNPIVDPAVEYKIAQSGDATCTGLFSPAEGSRTMSLKKTARNFKCKFPNWITKRKEWHTLDHSYLYVFTSSPVIQQQQQQQHNHHHHYYNSTLFITNTTVGNIQPSAASIRAIFGQDEVRINCVETIKSNNEYAQLLAYYLADCERGFVCVAIYKRGDHIAEIQMGTPVKRQEDACQKNFFNANVALYVTLVTTEPETEVCPFHGNFRVNGVSGMEQSVSDKLGTTDEQMADNKRSLSSVDIMSTYSDSLSAQNTIRTYSSSRIGSERRLRRYLRQTSTDLAATSAATNAVESSNRTAVSYVGFQSNARLNLSTTYVLTPAGRSTSRKTNHSFRDSKEGGVAERKSRDRSTVRRYRRSGANIKGDSRLVKKNSCILNFNKLHVGCHSPDTMEFKSDCPLFSSDINSVYLCHGSWTRNSTRNSSVHYLITSPLSRTGVAATKETRRYCFMYETSPDSNVVLFTSTWDTCHRDSVAGVDGASLSFNITPVGSAGKCAEVKSNSCTLTASVTLMRIVIISCLTRMICVCYYFRER